MVLEVTAVTGDLFCTHVAASAPATCPLAARSIAEVCRSWRGAIRVASVVRASAIGIRQTAGVVDEIELVARDLLCAYVAAGATAACPLAARSVARASADSAVPGAVRAALGAVARSVAAGGGYAPVAVLARAAAAVRGTAGLPGTAWSAMCPSGELQAAAGQAIRSRDIGQAIGQGVLPAELPVLVGRPVEEEPGPQVIELVRPHF